MSETELIEQVRAGNYQAFERLVKQYHTAAFRIALSFTGNRDIAMDLSQEAFIRVFRHRGELDPRRPFGAWLYRIVRNLAFNDLKRRRNRWRVFSDLFPESGAEDALPESGEADREEAREAKEQIWQGLAALKTGDREIIILKDIEGFRYQEIAEILDIPAGSVMSRLYHARKRLAVHVKRAALL